MGSRLEKNSAAVQKRIASHEFGDETGEEYEGSEFGGFGDYFRRKKLKLQNLDVELRANRGEKPQIFKGIVAHVTGYTQPPLHVLHKELVQHGAGFLQYLDSKTMATHIIASAMPPKKTADFTKYRVVKPAWVMDSIKAGKLLPWADYRVFDDGPRQKTIKFDGRKMLSQATQQSPTGYREQTQNSFYASQFQKSADRQGSQGSSSPFQPTPGALETIDDFDDMDIDEDVDMLLEDTKNLKQQVQGGDATSTNKPLDMESSPPKAEDHGPDQGVNSPQQPGRGKAMTSEEHNAILLQDPKIRKSSTANPDFLKQYYSESRLHHLSAWKAELKSRLMRMAAEKGTAAKAAKHKSGSRRYIMHVDFDSFFCAVSINQHAPECRDKPVVVAHSTGSGSEIASCNYPAREFGVKNGMWMKRAQELCPDLKVVPYDFPAYEEASRLFYNAILDVGGVVQSVSIDEALVDITHVVLSAAGSKGVGLGEGGIWREQEKADGIASNLRAEIKKTTACHVSVGIGGNILLAKIALRKAKPAGQYQIRPEEILDVLADLKVDDLPGVAYSIGGKLEEIGIMFVRDLRQTSKERLVSLLGPKTGEKLWEYARGIDRAEVGEQPIRKSVSADVNWGIRFVSRDEAEEFVRNLCKELERRLLNEGVKGKNLTMKIMRRALDAPLDPPKHLGHGKCDTFTKSIVFGVATNDSEIIGKESVSILRSYKFSPGDLRGLGVQMTKLEPIKPSAAAEGSQRKLTFGSAVPPAKRPNTEPIDDDVGAIKTSRSTGSEVEQDPITVDPLTPRKPKVHPALALARANAADKKANSPLNIAGTQFIIPSNADPAVLAELPQDIRSRLVKQAPHPRSAPSHEASPAIKSRSHSPAITEDVIPSDVDPEVFHALPEEMKAEVLASYGHRKQQRQSSAQTRLPQSPRKDPVIHRPKEKSTPTKRGGIQTLFGRARERQQDAEARLAQTTAAPIAGREQRQQEEGVEVNGRDGADMPPDELDPEFLAELPEDVRREVVEDHRRRRLAQKSGLGYHASARRGPAAAAAAAAGGGGGGGGRLDDVDGGGVGGLPRGQMRLKFPAKPAKVVFTQSKLTSVREIKDMVGVWHEATREDGPHRADVEVFEKYLARVVTEEKDMEKARVLVKWLGWIVEEGVEGAGKESWREAVKAVERAVQGAMKERGLGNMDFG